MIVGETTKFTPEEVEEVGNLVEDDEWLGLGMELAIVLRSAIRESVKGQVREFVGSDDYQVGDLSKEADARVKDAVAQMRGKDEYEVAAHVFCPTVVQPHPPPLTHQHTSMGPRAPTPERRTIR